MILSFFIGKNLNFSKIIHKSKYFLLKVFFFHLYDSQFSPPLATLKKIPKSSFLLLPGFFDMIMIHRGALFWRCSKKSNVEEKRKKSHFTHQAKKFFLVLTSWGCQNCRLYSLTDAVAVQSFCFKISLMRFSALALWDFSRKLLRKWKDWDNINNVAACQIFALSSWNEITKMRLITKWHHHKAFITK